MPRYIDADKAPSVMKEMPLCKQCIDAVMKMVIDRLPTEDVVEVRHGYWDKRYSKHVDHLGEFLKYEGDFCSICGALGDGKYCSECGAKMDGERSGNNGRE